MQLDMHYHGTYSMARAAGLSQDAAIIIATCAQFVDDNVAKEALEFEDGSRIDSEATAHHPMTLANLDPHDQRRVWVPFHFIPGNIGESYRDRMKCRKDSKPAREMIEHHLGFAGRGFARELIGIGAHVYADTFSHYGFSGISSRGNKIKHSSIYIDEGLDQKIKDYVRAKEKEFFKKKENAFSIKNIKSTLGGIVAEIASGALGHGAAATFPDRPFLKWSFKYDEDDAEAENRLSERNNPETFLEGCQALHRVFGKFSQANGQYNSGDGRPFSSIRDSVINILATQANKEGRIQVWKDAAESGKIFGTESGEQIPDYDGESWNEEWEAFNNQENYFKAIKSPVWQFYRAAAIHRTYVLRDLLPSYSLVVD